MRIAKLSIRNFRGIRTADLVIPTNCVILGPNNSGKSAIAEAVALVLGRERWLHNITEYDFFGANPESDTRFDIVATVTDFHPNITDPSHFPEWFNAMKGARPIWWLEDNQDISYSTDPPKYGKLALQVAVSGKYDTESCDFEARRYFFDGETDPFAIDPFIPFSSRLLRKFGLFLIPCLRHWERLLSFGSGQFLKLLTEIEALPAEEINACRFELKNPATPIEKAAKLGEILTAVEQELRSFLLLPEDCSIVYRPTQLSTSAILNSLFPHIARGDSIIPFSKQGAGFSSLQLFLIMLEYAKSRYQNGDNTIFVMEEPELHLQPSLQRRLIGRLRAYSNQTIITTHSQHIASVFKPSEVIHIQNTEGNVTSQIIYRGNIHASSLSNKVRQLYLRDRSRFYEALLGSHILVPEGAWDWQWLTLWIRVCEACSVNNAHGIDSLSFNSPTGLEIIHTQDSDVVGFMHEIRRFRREVSVILDGDASGRGKLRNIIGLPENELPKAILTFGDEGEIEDLSAWILEPLIGNPGKTLEGVVSQINGEANASTLGTQLKRNEEGGKRYKEDWELHENLAWEAYNEKDCCLRALQFFSDIVCICSGLPPTQLEWSCNEYPSKKGKVYGADFITGIK